MDALTALSTMAIVFVAAALRGLTGFGFALAAVPLLGLAMEPAQAVPISLLVVAAGGLPGAVRAAGACEWRSLRGLMIGAVVGSPVGAYLLTHIQANSARLAIACFTIAAVVHLSRATPAPVVHTVARDIAYGGVAGVFNGLAAMPGPPIVAYFMAAPMSREAIRASLLVFFQFTAIVGVVSAGALGLMTRDALALALASLPSFWLGNKLGARAFTMSTDSSYRRIALACLVAMAFASAVPALRALVCPC